MRDLRRHWSQQPDLRALPHHGESVDRVIRVRIINTYLASVHYQPSWFGRLLGNPPTDRLAIGPAPWCWDVDGRCHEAVQDAIADELVAARMAYLLSLK